MQVSTATQAQAAEVSQKDTYRLIIFDPAGTGVLLESQGSEYRLPMIEIPRFTRPANEVTEFVRNSWNLSSLFLFSGVLEEATNTGYFAVLESKDGFSLRAPGRDWFTVHHALSNLLVSGQERRAVESSYRKAVTAIRANPREPFCRVGWVRELEDWMRRVLGARGIELKGFEQLNGCETFSLIRFTTTQQPVWFKAVGEPNLHEYAISLALARLLPNYVPSVLATKPEWHGWLMADAGGTTLNEVQNPSAWQTAITTLADLQIDSIGKRDELLEAGCRDLRLATLLELVDPFLDTMAELMQQQTKVSPPVLSRRELSCLNAAIKDALNCLEALEISLLDLSVAPLSIGPKPMSDTHFLPSNISSRTCERTIRPSPHSKTNSDCATRDGGKAHHRPNMSLRRSCSHPWWPFLLMGSRGTRGETRNA